MSCKSSLLPALFQGLRGQLGKHQVVSGGLTLSQVLHEGVIYQAAILSDGTGDVSHHLLPERLGVGECIDAVWDAVPG